MGLPHLPIKPGVVPGGSFWDGRFFSSPIGWKTLPKLRTSKLPNLPKSEPPTNRPLRHGETGRRPQTRPQIASERGEPTPPWNRGDRLPDLAAFSASSFLSSTWRQAHGLENVRLVVVCFFEGPKETRILSGFCSNKTLLLIWSLNFREQDSSDESNFP